MKDEKWEVVVGVASWNLSQLRAVGSMEDLVLPKVWYGKLGKDQYCFRRKLEQKNRKQDQGQRQDRTIQVPRAGNWFGNPGKEGDGSSGALDFQVRRFG